MFSNNNSHEEIKCKKSQEFLHVLMNKFNLPKNVKTVFKVCLQIGKLHQLCDFGKSLIWTLICFS